MHFEMWSQVIGDFLKILCFPSVPFFYMMFGLSLNDSDTEHNQGNSEFAFTCGTICFILSSLISAGYIK